MASRARFAWLPWGDQPGRRFVGNRTEQGAAKELGESFFLTTALGAVVLKGVELEEFYAD